MSEPVVKQRPTIDLDDFERRLRQASAANARDEDPLAELARLVGEPYDPFNEVFAQEAAPAHAAAHHAAPQDHGYGTRQEPAFEAGAPAPRLFGNFADIEAGLRGAIPAHGEPAGAPGYPAMPGYEDAAQADYDQHAMFHQDVGAPSWAEPQPAARSRRPMMVMAATIAVGVVGIGAAFALKGHVGTSPREVKTIMADAGPTKIQPPPDAGSDTASADGGTLGGANQGSPTQLVNREEQPVDLPQAVQDNAARAAQTGATDAASVPVPPSPGQVQTASADPQTGSATPHGDAIGAQVQSFGLSDMPAPKRVKVVSVRPDGTILPDDQPPAAAMPAPRQAPASTSDRAAPVAKPATPKLATAKSTSRVTATPKSIASIAAGDDAAPTTAAPARPVKKAKPQRVASADPGQAATDAVAPAPTAETTDAAAPGAGGFAVQLAAPGSEADAKSTSSRLAKKFSAALAGRHLAFHKAESNGKSVYRVRVSSLSRADAVSLCEKLKADGGTCFVAKN
jgi:hypothetical protein